jgi:hypothetical protein
MILKNTTLLLSLAVLFSCQATHKSTSMETLTKQQEDWQPLFDGKTTTGWRTYGKQTMGKAWTVENGTLYLDAASKKDWQTEEGGDIVTEQSFDNFHLKLEWKIAPNGNSGIILFVQEDPALYPYPWSTGPEIQVLDNASHPDAKIQKHRAGDLYDLIACSPETVKLAGQWNQVEIISQNSQLTMKLNGTQVLATTLWDDTWKGLIAKSKFAQMPGFGMFKSGKIALQDHGDDVWYRNILIKRL